MPLEEPQQAAILKCPERGLDLNLDITTTDEVTKDDHLEEKRSEKRQKTEDALSYLAEHNLEGLLAEAMEMVVRSKPKNPHEFLANHILEYQRQMENQKDLLRQQNHHATVQKHQSSRQADILDGQTKKPDRSVQQRQSSSGNPDCNATLPRIQSTPVLQNHSSRNNNSYKSSGGHSNQARTRSDGKSDLTSGLPPVIGKHGEPWYLQRSESIVEELPPAQSAEFIEQLQIEANSKDRRIAELQARLRSAEYELS